MDVNSPLPLTLHFQDWKIRYAVLESSAYKNPNTKQTQSVVFVHGTPWSSAVYRPIINTLIAKGPYKILVYDLPGYGLSQEFSGPAAAAAAAAPTVSDETTTSSSKTSFQGDTSVKFQALALTALLSHTRMNGSDGNNSTTPAVIAHDIAGSIVLRAHLFHSIPFTSMLLLDTNAVLPWGDGFYKLARSNPEPFLALPEGIFEAMVRAVVQSALFSSSHSDTKKWEDILVAPWVGRNLNEGEAKGSGGQRSFVRQIAQANDQDVAEMLDGNMYAQVNCDVKIVWGKEDQWIPREKVEELCQRLGDRVKEFVVVEGAGHLVMLDQPERVVVEVVDWLRR